MATILSETQEKRSSDFSGVQIFRMASDRTLVFRENHGLGPILFRWQKGRTGCLIATAGVDCSVAIFNRQGNLQERIILSGESPLIRKRRISCN